MVMATRLREELQGLPILLWRFYVCGLLLLTLKSFSCLRTCTLMGEHSVVLVLANTTY